MYAPHIVTMYNIVTTIDEDFTEQIETYITVLKGVFINSSTGRNVTQSGTISTDTVTLYIPFEVDAYDGVTGVQKSFIQWKNFKNIESKSKYYTVNGIEKGLHSFFVKDEIILPNSNFDEINAICDKAYTVTKVDICDFGTKCMQHIMVSGA